MKKYFLFLLFLSSLAFASQSGTVDLGPTIGGGGGSPTGPAGGDLSGTYPNPTVPLLHQTASTVAYFDTLGNLTSDPNASYLLNYTPAAVGAPVNGVFASGSVFGYVFGSLDVSVDSPTVNVGFLSGSNTAVGAAQGTGGMIAGTGGLSDPGETASSGTVSFQSGSVAGSGNSGQLRFATGNASSGQSGQITLGTGFSSGNSGNVLLSVGAAGGTRGNIQFQNGTQGTAGQCWISTDSSGSGSWQPCQSLTFSDSLVNTSGNVTLINDTTINDGSHFDYYYGTNAFAVAGYNHLPVGSAGNINSSVTVIAPSSAANTILGQTNDPMGNIISNAFNMYDNFGDNIASMTEASNGLVISANENSGSFVGSLALQTIASSNAITGNVNISTGIGTGVASGNVTIETGNTDTQAAGEILIQPGSATDASSSAANGGNVNIVGGATASSAGLGGGVSISGGPALTTAMSGFVSIFEGNNNIGINITPTELSISDVSNNIVLRTTAAGQVSFLSQIYSSTYTVAPTVSSCGTSPSLSTKASDGAGAITIGSGATTSCTLTFANAWSSAPHCFVNTRGVTSLVASATPTTTTMTINFSLSAASDVVDYWCIGEN